MDEWKYKVFDDVKARVQKLKKIGAKHARHNSIMHSQSVKTYLKKLHENFVLVPTDKASNNIAVVCKNFYIQKSIEELGINEDTISNQKDDSTQKILSTAIKGM